MSKKILVIDDEPEFRSTLQEVLEGEGYQVEGSHYLATTVGIGLTGRYDLVTLDLKMPEVDGLEVARLYRKKVPQTHILVISGYLDDSAVARLKDLGVGHLLSKPAGVSDLIEAVDKAISSPRPTAIPQTANRQSNGNGHYRRV